MRLLVAVVAASLSILAFAAAPSLAASLRLWLMRGEAAEPAMKKVSYTPAARPG